MHGRQWAATRKYPPLGRCRGTGGDRAIDTATGEMETIPTLPNAWLSPRSTQKGTPSFGQHSHD